MATKQLTIAEVYDWVYNHPRGEAYHPAWHILGWSETKSGKVKIRVRFFGDENELVIDAVTETKVSEVQRLHRAIRESTQCDCSGPIEGEHHPICNVTLAAHAQG